MPRKARKSFSAEQKVTLLRRHLIDHEPVSTICEEHDLLPTVFYRWQRQFFENGAAAFGPPARDPISPLEAKIAALESRLQRKHEVLSELMEEHLELKKEFGES